MASSPRRRALPTTLHGMSSPSSQPRKDILHPQSPASSMLQPRCSVVRSRLRIVGTALCLAFVVVLLRQSRKFSGSSYTLCVKGSAHIYTVEASKPTVQCIAVSDGSIEATGTFDELHSRGKPGLLGLVPSLLWQRSPPVHWISTGAVVPGISDAHAHILAYGQSRQLDVRDARSPEEVVVQIRNYILSNPDIRDDPSRWIEGAGFDHTSWNGGKFPTASDFGNDPLVSGRYIVMHSKDAHALWVSQPVLDKFCPCEDVPGGIVQRDANGEANGIFIDDANALIKIPPPDESVKEAWFNVTMKDALQHGLTAIHDAGLEAASVPLFKRMADDDKLPIRIYAMRWYDVNGTYWGDKETVISDYGARHRLNIRSVKLFTDGALRTGGAALYEPYTDNPTTRGVLRIPPEVLHDIIPKFLRDGWQVNTHAIGDRANGIFLDVMEAASPDLVRARRPRVEHAQIVSLKDLGRFGDLGVIASVQPTHATDDMWYAEERLGSKRIRGTYAWKSLLKGGARLALGSDMPVEGVSPFAGFYAAITRLTPEGTSPHGSGGWFPEECLSRQEALKGMTLDAAFASFTEHFTGSLKEGKRADFVVLDRDIMTVPAKDILLTKVLATVVDGHVAYGSLQ
ncbi:amidohydrolase family-domain-containing protein [Auriculariales sp. MPI-PUGE-AT-0066]|nr:amidohydrolase family-domain-containing protein [Auriculariales sp. MPI-PUGE-AT-0066]